ncbi:Alpha/Beta hydrolase protein [Mariannaea sp. PMI_226]|nr:Alpha/Beta hydrolase protein [Mariannaea sp. PMI_226]
MRLSTISTVLLGLTSAAHAIVGLQPGSKRFRVKTTPDIFPKSIHESTFKRESTQATLKYVENSGVCETTPGVNQYSGYVSLGKNMSMWFWFFEARKNPEHAPLALWLNGGPGCSSMVGLLQENGPCHFVGNDTEPTLNPYSWNEYANMLYVDQPIGAGFSFGEYAVNSTIDAAPYVWEFLQAFLGHFSKYRSRDFGLFTESYGGHYGPEFALYFMKQNDAIQHGTAIGEPINLVALGMNNAWIDPRRQFLAYATYADDNPYRKILNNSTATLERFENDYKKYCLPAMDNCTQATGQDEACSSADATCNEQMYLNLQIASGVDFNVYDVLLKDADEVPPDNYLDWLTRKDIMNRIGARTRFAECDEIVYDNFTSTGDDARTFAHVLEEVIGRNITTLLWAGDLDWICNVEGMLDTANHLKWDGQDKFVAEQFKNYTVGGKVKGVYKTVQNVSFMKVYEAGHELPYYQPETALQVFKQIMGDRQLTST